MKLRTNTVFCLGWLIVSVVCSLIGNPVNAHDPHKTPSLQYTWTPASGPVDHYKVYVSVNNGAFVVAGETSDATPAYTLAAGVSGAYRVKVQAVNAQGRIGPFSEVSDPVTVDLPLWLSEMRLSFNEGVGQSLHDSNNFVVGHLGFAAIEDAYDPKWSHSGLSAPEGGAQTLCLHFTRVDNGLDVVRMTAVDALNNSKAITVSMFVNQPNRSAVKQFLFYKHGVWDALEIYLKNGRLHVDLRVSEVAQEVQVSGFKTGQWQHIAVTFDGYTIFIYLQGRLVAGAFSPDFRSMANMIVNDIGYGFSGFIDEVVLIAGTVWNSADVAAEYQRGLAGIPAPPLQLTPVASQLEQNYPNPFNPETWIPYQLSEASPVVIQIYDAKGTLVRELDLGVREAGYYHSQGRAAYWDGRNMFGERVASGAYFYRLQTADDSATRKMIILK